ncbi:hypothetical protein FJTKL_13378 [Diaporthe vaccinii]|uniref:Uncharacterized protein n=1 Tax=Diaporthe vaccinii TaxID=105482 RepID=A0ABR4EAL6_9PEZI
MKFSVAVPLVALLTASILALLALLAGIRPHFMPDAYIVRIAKRSPITPYEPTPTSTVPRVPAKGGNTALPTITGVPPAQSTESKGKKTKGETTEKTKTKTRTKKITVTTETTKTKTKTKKITVTTETTKTKTKTNKPKSTSDASPFKHEVLPIISARATATASTRTASPTYGSVETDKSSKQENWHIFEWGGRRRVEPMDNAQVIFPVMKHVPGAGVNDHVLIHGRSDPGNHTSNETATNLFTYSMHFLTNCQWNVKNKAENCSKPWDFGSNFFGSEVMEGKPPQNNSLEERHLPQSSPFLFKRKATDPNGSEPEEEDEEETLQEVWKKMKKNRAGFSKVHLTGCVLVGLSFLCTAISFFILPALGKWISVGNLFLATLATICLLTSSIFTAVLAKEVRDRHKKSKLTEYHDVESGNKFKALV